MSHIRIRYVRVADDDEMLEVRQHADGGYICPVCGDNLGPGGEAPWEDTWAEGSTRVTATGSHNICSVCNTQYGFDDIPFVNSGLKIKDRWWQLRIAWLDRTGWQPESLKQLHENLGITEDQTREQAKTLR